jgi:hypothetical protein
MWMSARAYGSTDAAVPESSEPSAPSALVGETYEAWVDDGDPAISDPRKNRMRVRQRVRSADIEKDT